jgi:hypothetical protein
MTAEDTTRRIRAIQVEDETIREALARFDWDAPLGALGEDDQGTPTPSQSASG